MTYVEWEDSSGSKHMMGVDAARRHLRYFFEEWPCGISELESEITRYRKTISALEAECDRLERYWNEALATHENIDALKSRIAELEQDNTSLRNQNTYQDKALATMEAKLAQRVPDGWQRVPAVPTHMMELRGSISWENSGQESPDVVEIYQVMLAAAPAAPEQPKAVPLTELQRLSMEELEAIFQCGGDVYTNVQSALAAKNGMELADASAKKVG